MTDAIPTASTALLGLLLSTPAFADGWIRELRGGALAHDVGRLWSRKRVESGIDWNAEVVFWWSGLGLRWGTLHPNLGVGAAIHDGKRERGDRDRKALGSRVLFRIPIELGDSITEHHRLMVTFDHVSNADLASPNHGLDTLGVRYGYRF